jgi:tetratricopeptide (TPR) repeat protein
MVRASALSLLGHYDPTEGNSEAFAGLRDPEGLVRYAAVRSLQHLHPQRRVQRIAPLLDDPLRSVRTEAARVLSDIPSRQLSPERRQAFDHALAEYLEGQEAVGDQAAARLNKAVVYNNLGDPQKAEREYEIALRIDPQFVPAMINLAMLYDRQNLKDEAEALFEKVIALEPGLAEAHYSLGLLIAENPKRLTEAVEHLAKAVAEAPENARMRYNYALALQNLARYAEAEKQLREADRLAPREPDYLYALAILYAQQGRWTRAIACAEEMVRRWPGEGRGRQLLGHFRQQQAAGRRSEADRSNGNDAASGEDPSGQ